MFDPYILSLKQLDDYGELLKYLKIYIDDQDTYDDVVEILNNLIIKIKENM